MPQIQQSAIRNRLLTALPPDTFAWLTPFLRPVDLPLKQDLVAVDVPIETVHFVESGMVSMIATLEAGNHLEVGLVGREGMVGLPVVLGNHVSSTGGTVQLKGMGLSLPAPRLRDALDADPALRSVLLRYAQAFHAQVAQTAACNGRHVLQERLARWLLMAHDRAGADAFLLTQEFLSNMLGVRRPGITVAVGALQRAGLIRHEQGRLTVLDRAGLEEASCECYRVVRRHFERLLD